MEALTVHTTIITSILTLSHLSHLKKMTHHRWKEITIIATLISVV